MDMEDLNNTKKYDWIVIGLVGTTKYDNAEYFIDDESINDFYASIALARKQYRKSKNGKIILSFTPESYSEHFEKVKGKIEKDLNGVKFEPIQYNIENTNDLLEQIFNQINLRDCDENIYFDITNTYRHIPIYIFPEILFIQEQITKRKNIQIYYAREALESTREKRKYVFECINDSQDLSDWNYATKSFIENVNAKHFTTLLESTYHKLKKGSSDKLYLFMELSKAINRFTKSFKFGDVIAIGLNAAIVKELIDEIDRNKILDSLPYPWVYQIAFKNILPRISSVSIKSMKNKNEVILNKEELKRELELVKWYLKIQDYQNTTQILREFIVNVFIYTENPRKWLNTQKRKEVENLMYDIFNDKIKSHSMNKLFIAWQEIRKFRNYISHCGFQTAEIPKIPDEIRQLLKSNIEDIIEMASISVNSDFYRYLKK